nr:glycosyltransferase [uncultured Rhodopila sp.]
MSGLPKFESESSSGAVPRGQHILPFSFLVEEVSFVPDSDQVILALGTLKKFVRHVLRFVPVDFDFYAVANPDLAKALIPLDQKLLSHYQDHGYFEGRHPQIYHFPEMESDPLMNPIPHRYFELLCDAQDSLCDGRSALSTEILAAAAQTYPNGFHANYTCGDIMIHQFDSIRSLEFLIAALSLRPNNAKAIGALKLALSTIRDKSVSRDVFQALRTGFPNAPVWLSVESCKNFFHLEDYEESWRCLVDLRSRSLPRDVCADLREVVDGLATRRRWLRDVKKKHRCGQLSTSEILLGLLHLVRFGRSKVVERLLQHVDIAAVQNIGDSELTIELIRRISGVRDTLKLLDDNPWNFNQALIVTLKVSLLSKHRMHHEIIDYMKAKEGSSLSNSTSLVIAKAMLFERHYDQLALFCRAWRSRTKDDAELGPYKYRLLAAILSGAIQSVVINRHVVEMHLLKTRNVRGRSRQQYWGNIPKHIFQFWHAVVPPQEVKELCSQWSQEFGDSNYRLFSDDTACEFIATHYDDEVLALYNFCYHPAMKADVFRLLYLYKMGGVYSDADNAPLPGFSWLVHTFPAAKLIIVVSGIDPGLPMTLTNLFIAAVPGHIVIKNALEDALNGLRRAIRDNVKPGILSVTGPGALTRGLGKLLMSDDPELSEVLRHIIIYDGHSHHNFVGQSRTMHYKTEPLGHWGEAERIAQSAARLDVSSVDEAS